MTSRHHHPADAKPKFSLTLPPSISKWMSSFALAVGYVLASSRAHKAKFCTGVSVVTIVVSFTAILYSTIQFSPLVFLKLAEDSVGMNDIVFLPETVNNSFTYEVNAPLINYTFVQEALDPLPSVAGSVPRWVLLADVESREDSSLNSTVIMLAIDTDLEEEAGLGRDWGRRPLGPDEVYVSDTALADIAATVGDKITIRIDWQQLLSSLSSGDTADLGTDIPDGISPDQVSDLLDAFGVSLDPITVQGSDILEALYRLLGLDESNIPSTDITVELEAEILLSAALNSTIALQLLESDLAITKDVSVLGAVGKPRGKWPTALGNVVVLEARHLTTWLHDIVDGILDQAKVLAAAVGLGQEWDDIVQPIRDEVYSIDYPFLQQYAMQVVVMYANRAALYVQSGEAVKAGTIDFTNELAGPLGVNFPVGIDAPLATALEGTAFIRMFLDQIFGAVVFLMVMLGVMVIYALILGDVESKTYEYGMLRVLGMPHATLAQLIAVQTTLFSIPGILLGLSVASLLNLVVAKVVSDFAGIEADKTMPPLAWVFGVLIGSVMPAMANVVPIRRAMSSTLRDAIDMYHQTFNDVTVTLLKLAKMGLSPWQLALAIIMVIVGVVTYYLIPLAFVIRDFALFLTILNVILLGMLLGLSLMASALQALTERAVLWLMLWRADTKLWTLITKNLAGHRSRNRKTAYMIVIAIAFLIFAGAMFALQNAAIKDNVRMFVGSDLLVLWTGAADTSLPQQQIIQYLDSVSVDSAAGPAIVAGYTFVTHKLNVVDGWRTRNRVMNLAEFPRPRTSFYGVQANYLDVCYDEFEVVGEEQPGSKGSDVVTALHAGAGDITLPIESNLDAAPPSVLTSPSRSLAYVCNVTTEDDAKAKISEEGYFYWTLEVCQAACVNPCFGADYTENSTALDRHVEVVYDRYVDVISSEALRPLASVDVETPLRLNVEVRTSQGRLTNQYLGKARAFVSKMPGLFFSSYRQTAWGAPSLLRMQDYARLLLEAEQYVASLGDVEDDGGSSAVVDDDDQEGGAQDDDGAATGGSGSLSNPSPSPAPGTVPASGTSGTAIGISSWRNSVTTWTQNNNDLYSSPVSSTVRNVLDNDPSTFVSFGDGAPPASFVVDLGTCLAVSGVRFQHPVPAQPATDAAGWTLEAGADVAGPFTVVGSGTLTAASGGWQQTMVTTTSARYWRVTLTSTLSGATTGGGGGVTLGDVQFQLGASSSCEAALLVDDDLVIGVPKNKLHIRMTRGTEEDRERVQNALSNFMEDDFVVFVDTIDTLGSADDAVSGLQGFFTFVAALCLVLIFFASWLSFDSNIRENVREFGILRSLGLSIGQVSRVYLYEALSVVLASFVLGATIGFLIAISLTLQFNLFVEMPFKFVYPTLIFWFSFCVCVVVAVVSSMIPVRAYAKVTIANIVKGRTSAS